MHLFEKLAPVELRPAATLLTGTLVATDVLEVANESYVSLEITTTNGTGGTSPEVQVTPEVSSDGGTTWRPAVGAFTMGTPTGGAITSAPSAVTYTFATAGEQPAIHVPVYGGFKFRCRVKQTGTPDVYGTCGIRAVRSRLGA